LPTLELEVGIRIANKIAACAPLGIKTTLTSAHLATAQSDANALPHLQAQFGALSASWDLSRRRHVTARRLIAGARPPGHRRSPHKCGCNFDHILVDEYQDTNRLQAEILLALAPDGAGLTVVGDDAQAIYGFRAANVRNILDFPDQFSPPAMVIALEHNYRSTQPILAAANAVMARASEGFAKTLTSSKPSAELPYLVTVEDEAAQAVFVAEQVLEQREAGIELRHQAVLFRASHHSARLEIELARRNIPFVKYGGLKFIEAAHVKDLLAILRWVENPRDTIAGFRALQLLPGIGPASAKKVTAYLGDHRFDLGELGGFAPPAAAALCWPQFCRLLRDLHNGAIAWAGQIGAVRAWYQPHLERFYDYATARAGDLEQLEPR
jgi:DNA helicase-2/ATP-dependent DNA helicase PcrA